MNPDAIALFRELADRSPLEREEYYARHRVPAPLRAEVESLLDFDDRSVDSIQDRVAAVAREALFRRRDASKGSNNSADITRSQPESPVVSDSGEGRFPAGTVLAGRYRIISLLGRGGMGEVYRATDLKLNQAVALKLLPKDMAGDERLLERLYGEVRLARQISHPNVCRVYDIGEFDGIAYISMEYVDGEDLASLLTRIGRLPYDKALEIARRLCAGLAAAHDKGVVHRDLKPANIMVDRRGQVFITDFGLASTARDLKGAEVRSGTPAYMAPEQLTGREVSIRSDIYALGLILYEMLSGRRAFEHRRDTTLKPPPIEHIVRDVDAAVAGCIGRCLELDPRDRPASALAVAAALPGGNRLAEALAAGVTPSPQMVAASRDTDAISIRTAVSCLSVIIAGLMAVMFLSSRASLLRLTPFENPPQVLSQKARDLIAAFGYAARPFDTATGFFGGGNYQIYAELREPVADYRAQLAHGQPPLIFFWYRQSPRFLVPYGPTSIVQQNDPPLLDPGEVLMWLDQRGRLMNLQVVPPAEEYATPSQRQPDWDSLFAAAGVDRARFSPAEPEWVPASTFDARAAWTGTYAHAPSVPMRVEAAAWKGRPVYFRLIGPWTDFQGRFSGGFSGIPRAIVAGTWLVVVVSFVVLAGAGLVAWRNHRHRRGDLQGASHLSAIVFGTSLLGWLLTAHQVPTQLGSARPALYWALADALGLAVACWVLYMAVEPFVRRRWPQSLITWTRLLAGGVRDPLVAGHVLIGTALGVAFATWYAIESVVFLRQGAVGSRLDPSILNGAGWMMNSWLLLLAVQIIATLGSFVMFLLLRVIFRREWAAGIGFIILASAPSILISTRPLIDAVFALPVYTLSLWILIRFGVLPMVVANFVSAVLIYFPITADFSAWYSGATWFALATVIILALWSLRTAVAGRPVLHDEFLAASA
jgi:serine/threonine-protein kinase